MNLISLSLPTGTMEEKQRKSKSEPYVPKSRAAQADKQIRKSAIEDKQRAQPADKARDNQG